MWVSGVESTQLLTTDKPKVCFWGGPVSVLGDPLRPLWQWLYMPASINFVVGVSQGRCQGGQGYIQTMVYSIHNIRALWRKCLNTRSCGCFLRGYPPFLTHLAVYYTHISPGVCKNSGCLSTLDSSWFFRSNICEGVTSIHKEGPCFIYTYIHIMRAQVLVAFRRCKRPQTLMSHHGTLLYIT